MHQEPFVIPSIPQFGAQYKSHDGPMREGIQTNISPAALVSPGLGFSFTPSSSSTSTSAPVAITRAEDVKIANIRGSKSLAEDEADEDNVTQRDKNTRQVKRRLDTDDTQEDEEDKEGQLSGATSFPSQVRSSANSGQTDPQKAMISSIVSKLKSSERFSAAINSCNMLESSMASLAKMRNDPANNPKKEFPGLAADLATERSKAMSIMWHTVQMETRLEFVDPLHITCHLMVSIISAVPTFPTSTNIAQIMSRQANIFQELMTRYQGACVHPMAYATGCTLKTIFDTIRFFITITDTFIRTGVFELSLDK